MEIKRYRDYPSFFKTLFQERVQKLSIDGGFTCPNRDGKKGTGGCTFCNNRSFNPGYCVPSLSITRQIEEGRRFFAHKYAGQKYLAYFQAYSNTYAPLEILRQKYEEALACPDVVGLVIGTRPDTVNEEILAYLEELAKYWYVCVEYGVESANEGVLRRINRGHTFAEAETAIRMTAGRGIRIGAHLIFGLPGETRESMLQGAVRLCELPIDILKLHQLQIIRDTPMADEYLHDPDAFRLYSLDEYLDFVADVIGHIRPEVYLERFVNQAPEEYLVAPKWGVKNFEFVAKLDKKLKEKDIWQGKWRSLIGQQKVYDTLEALEIPFDYIEHPPAPTIEIARQYWTALEGKHCKNLFFRNHKGNRHYLVIFDCDRNLAIHDLEQRLKQGKMSFASEKRMVKYLGLYPGSVSPFGLLNDEEHHVYVFLDENLRQTEKLSFHPNDNRASLSIKTEDFIRYMDTVGNGYEWIKLY